MTFNLEKSRINISFLLTISTLIAIGMSIYTVSTYKSGLETKIANAQGSANSATKEVEEQKVEVEKLKDKEALHDKNDAVINTKLDMILDDIKIIKKKLE